MGFVPARQHVASGIRKPDDDASVLNPPVGIEELGSNGSYPILGGMADKLLEPLR